MNAEQLIVKQGSFDPDKLAELIDAHNALVRHIFASATTPVLTTKPSRFDDPVKLSLADIQAGYHLMLMWGHRCMCVFPTPTEVRPDVFHCVKCSKPYQQPLED